MVIQHNFYDNKYTVTFHNSGQLEALRYGDSWRELTGDGLVLAMLQDYDNLKQKSDIDSEQIESLLNEIAFLKNKLRKVREVFHEIESIQGCAYTL
jgi:hypothetical protein